MWGRGLVKVIRALGDRVEVMDTNGQRFTVRPNKLTMKNRPNGADPTDSEKAVLAEDRRRTEDPERGDGETADDLGGAQITREPPETTGMSIDMIAALPNDVLEDMFGNGWTDGYDPATMERLGDELDKREQDKAAWLTGIPENANLHDQTTAPHLASAFDAAWPQQWIDWVRDTSGGPAPAKSFHDQMLSEWLDYSEWRFLAAEKATNGQMLKPQYRDNPDLLPPMFGGRGERAFFDGSVNRANMIEKYGSPELVQWLAENGTTLSLAEWIKLKKTGVWNPGRKQFTEHG